MKFKISDTYKDDKDALLQIVNNFNDFTDYVVKAERNSIKKMPFKDFTINVKAFKTPNLINKFVYRFFRKSKAERSYTYANKLLSLGVLTPEPIAYFEFPNAFSFGKSFYISKQLDYDITYRELCSDFEYPNHNQILKAFTKFTYDMHEKGVNFLDHSQGNTLIKKTDVGYDFYLVDLNRMEFKTMDFEARMQNFSRLSKQEEIVSVMVDEYAKLYNKSVEDVNTRMWFYINEFQNKRKRKKQLKKKLLFRS